MLVDWKGALMKAYIALASAFAIISPTVAAAKGAPSPKPPPELIKALDAMAPAAATPPGQTNKKPEHDQGDDNASPRAIERVCTKDTPSAQRSAICPRPVSPN